MRAQINFNKPFVILTSQPKAKVQAQIDAVSFSLSLSPSLALSLPLILPLPSPPPSMRTHTHSHKTSTHARTRTRAYTHTHAHTQEHTLSHRRSHKTVARLSLARARSLLRVNTHANTPGAVRCKVAGNANGRRRLCLEAPPCRRPRGVFVCFFFPKCICMHIHIQTHTLTASTTHAGRRAEPGGLGQGQCGRGEVRDLHEHGQGADAV